MPLQNPSPQAEISSGTFTGDNTVNRAIPHGLSRTPKIVMLINPSQGCFGSITVGYTNIVAQRGAATDVKGVTAPNATNFYVGHAGDYITSMNSATHVIYWVAIT